MLPNLMGPVRIGHTRKEWIVKLYLHQLSTMTSDATYEPVGHSMSALTAFKMFTCTAKRPCSKGDTCRVCQCLLVVCSAAQVCSVHL